MIASVIALNISCYSNYYINSIIKKDYIPLINNNIINEFEQIFQRL